MSERKFAKGKFTPEAVEHEELSAIGMVARKAWREAKQHAHTARRRGSKSPFAISDMRDAFVAKMYVSRKLTERWERLLGGVG